eukprot:4125110-Amphidinium_carterae.1
MAMLVQLTGMFALRCNETCNLTRECLRLNDNPPVLRVLKQPGSGKSPGNIPITPEAKTFLHRLQTTGLKQER